MIFKLAELIILLSILFLITSPKLSPQIKETEKFDKRKK